MKVANFKFELYQKVIGPLTDGVVTMQAVDNTDCITYYVENKDDGVANSWIPETQLKPIV